MSNTLRSSLYLVSVSGILACGPAGVEMPAVGGDLERAASTTVSDTLTIDATDLGQAIPADYVGLSFSRDSISGAGGYEQLFDPTKNRNYSHLVNLLRQIGVKHLRTISGTASATEPDPSGAQDDLFFQFARDAGLGDRSVIYSLHLFDEDDAHSPPNTSNTATASYIWKSSIAQPLIESFALDNESDWKYHYRSPYPDPVIRGYDTPPGMGYKDRWTQLYKEVQHALGGPDPPVPFSGPDTGSNYPVNTDPASNTSIGGVPFTLRFAMDQRPRINLATQHYYGGNNAVAPVWVPGSYRKKDVVQDPKDSGHTYRCIKDDPDSKTHPQAAPAYWAPTSLVLLSAFQMAKGMLSAQWLADYAKLYDSALAQAPGWPAGLSYRLTESNAYSGGRDPDSPIFATALWALDYFHFWARHGCAGVDPFTRVAQYNSPIFQGPDGDFVAEPYAYGMLAFNQGGHGTTINEAGFSFSTSHDWLTGYGVVNSSDLYVTLINKTFRSIGSIDAAVMISKPTGFTPMHARYLVLASGPGQSGDATVKSATLGEATIPTTGDWAGSWHSIQVNEDGSIGPLAVPATCAVIVDIMNE